MITAHLPEVSFPHFTHGQLVCKKDEVIDEGQKSIRKRTRTRKYVLQTSGPVLLPLRKNNGGMEIFMSITANDQISLDA